ncbi:unnamed protein product [Mycetohabitans rhizoxinica HKI 454]|uniref:Uncharacterized protein n=1 Tax=Mycetohabitans rhizoxinica (strain DSM 19002 / CIP 109453 / HKI 454) TaxID=882378 RepID=E5AR45_MYCRK|nr:unnamed protein product [Mycetohabitans rhizoxinica HKI 454]
MAGNTLRPYSEPTRRSLQMPACGPSCQCARRHILVAAPREAWCRHRACPAGAIEVGMCGAGNTSNEYSRSVVNRYIRGFVVARHWKGRRVRAALVTGCPRLRPSGRYGRQRGARAAAQ